MPHLPQWRVSELPVAYEDALAQMQDRVQQIIEGQQCEQLWLLEHPPLYTAGTSAKTQDLLTPKRFPVYETGRGGQYTYHGPGQRVVYAMLDLKKRMHSQPDIRYFVWLMEEWVIRTLAAFGVKGERREGRVGIWVVNATGGEDKIAAIGIRLKRWVSFHGLCINLNPDLEHYSGIIPCGISQHGVTSLHQLGVNISMLQLDEELKRQFEQLPWEGKHDSRQQTTSAG